jgi:diguanylate cyclase (GGDEF)-like protein
VYAQLALMVALGIGLSVATSVMVDDVQHTSTVLLRQDVPKLERFTAFESALLLHQAAIDNDFAYPAEHERFHAVADSTMRAMREQYRTVASEISSSYDSVTLQREFNRLVELDQILRVSLDTRRGSDSTRRQVATFNAYTGRIRELIDGGRRHLQSAVSNSGRLTMERTRWIANLVHLYAGFALLSALSLVYHVRARIRSERELAYLAAHDTMTKLPHRWSFYQEISKLDNVSPPHRRTKRHNDVLPARDAQAHLLLIEADRFDRMVAGIGHAGADEVVLEMALRANQAALANGGEVFRLGDSKFALVLESTPEAVQQLATRLQTSMGTPIAVGHHEIVLSTSMGSAALSRPDQRAIELVQEAEMALHLARQQGSSLVTYCTKLDDQLRDKLAMEAQLRHAIERGELELHYQPQKRMADGELIGFEALLRWHSATGMVSPAEFIPLAEESGLIGLIGDWVLGQASAQAAAWNRELDTPLTIAINISPRQFAQPRFVERVRHHLAQSGVNPRHIELEITEGVLMEQAALSRELLGDLRGLGLQLAIDDFGTGYSSLAYLKRFRVHKLKIDQTFVRQLKAGGEDAEIVKAVISLGHNLGFSVIAEGVELGGDDHPLAEQASLLRQWGCDEIQGYFYGRPMSATAAEAFIAAARPRRLLQA